MNCSVKRMRTIDTVITNRKICSKSWIPTSTFFYSRFHVQRAGLKMISDLRQFRMYEESYSDSFDLWSRESQAMVMDRIDEPVLKRDWQRALRSNLCVLTLLKHVSRNTSPVLIIVIYYYLRLSLCFYFSTVFNISMTFLCF